jgi:uncharacterized protein (TIGR03437 family)
MANVTRLSILLVSAVGPIFASSPVVNAIVNAASYSRNCSGTPPSCALSPGEIVSIFGTSLGPAVPQTLQYDPQTGTVLTLLGSDEAGNPCNNEEICFSWVQVIFNTPTGGYPAPLLYVSATQINCIVPYEIVDVSIADMFAGPHLLSLLLDSSNGATTQVTGVNLVAVVENSLPAATPGVFTDNSSGTGQGAILNQDGSVNSPSRPANPGDIVSVFMMGTGWQCTNPGCVIEFGVAGSNYSGMIPPAMIDGMITCILGCPDVLDDIPAPVLPVTALVNGNMAEVVWAGLAPFLVSGVLQVNLKLPSNTAAGAIPLVVGVGDSQSQSGVTVSVK